ncbi:MAG: PaaI family thioesterase [bacterium]|nr:PaaI family thioesterase [bacterium]
MKEKLEIPRTGQKVEWCDDGCFVCGRNNQIGLHIKFDFDRENHRAMASHVFSPEHQGWDRVVHGGIIAAVLDDVMAYAIMTTNNLAITTRMSVTYRKEVRVGETVYLDGWIEKLTSRAAKTKGVLYTLENGEKIVKAEADGTYFLDRPEGVERK